MLSGTALLHVHRQCVSGTALLHVHCQCVLQMYKEPSVHPTVMGDGRNNKRIQTIVKFHERKYHLLKYQKNYFHIKRTGRRTIIRKFIKQLILSYELTFPNCTPTVFKFFCNKSTSNLMHCRWLVIINKVVFVLNHSRH